jgi:hypothetical protein
MFDILEEVVMEQITQFETSEVLKPTESMEPMTNLGERWNARPSSQKSALCPPKF